MRFRFSIGTAGALAAAVTIFAAVGCTDTSNTAKADSGKPGGNPGGNTPTTPGALRPATKVAGNKISGNTIPIGLVASLSGDLKPWGQDEQRGAELAVKEVNAAGGVNGKQIQLLVEDSQSHAEPGKSAAEKLIGENVLGLVGE